MKHSETYTHIHSLVHSNKIHFYHYTWPYSIILDCWNTSFLWFLTYPSLHNDRNKQFHYHRWSTGCYELLPRYVKTLYITSNNALWLSIMSRYSWIHSWHNLIGCEFVMEHNVKFETAPPNVFLSIAHFSISSPTTITLKHLQMTSAGIFFIVVRILLFTSSLQSRQ